MRAEALKWWRSLTIEQMYEYAKKYFPNIPPELVFASSGKIEKIYTDEKQL